LWMQKNWIGSDGFKFRDYDKSVGLSVYEPLSVDQIKDLSMQEVLAIFASHGETLPPIDLSEIQQKLLSVFPFKLGVKSFLHSF